MRKRGDEEERGEEGGIPAGKCYTVDFSLFCCCLCEDVLPALLELNGLAVGSGLGHTGGRVLHLTLNNIIHVTKVFLYSY